MTVGNRFDAPVVAWTSSYLAEVVSVEDPDRLTRVQIRLLNCDGLDDQDGPLWARVAVPFAGANRGAFFLPDVGDEVLVIFLNGDPRFPMVVGGLWNGHDEAPDSLPGDRVDRWTITGKAGTKISIVEERNGHEKIVFHTPAGVTGTLTDEAGGKIKLEAAGNTITMDTSGVSIQAAATVSVQASQVEVTAGMVTVNAGMSKFSGVVQCDTLITNTVVSAMYTPGAGNVW
ncbi:MAG: phage baseplate assembly protein V [Nitrospirota bacterium]|nr:phage baseplate assembly protein V [Nitrospirota bacterium]MDP2383229.1 phage baseplate assembly protein V [Nitrospirota bacterium]MDP3598636.1 phage baseplate assembly protein V [Nitrospirota bacterium]